MIAVGDAAKVRLDLYDVVLLNLVSCCYPEVDSSLGNSLSAATSIYAFTAPASAGPAGFFARAETGMANTWSGCETGDSAASAAGFLSVTEGRRRLVWHLAIDR